jgi:predicted TIM-barrel fold metal-dependent hydrolase
VVATSASLRVRGGLSHPVIDGDGHIVDFLPALRDFLRAEGGETLAQQVMPLTGVRGFGSWMGSSWEQRRERRLMRGPWLGFPTGNTLDRCTSSIPRLLYERLDEFGIDFAVCFGSGGLVASGVDPGVRRAATRAMVRYHHELYGEYADRLTIAAQITMDTPQQAVEDLEHAVAAGAKVVSVGPRLRVVPAAGALDPSIPPAMWVDALALDSAYDFDPFWRRCVELRVPVAAHTGGIGWHHSSSISSYVFNHIGHFAVGGETFCKALILGGVMRRFPELRVGFMEGGALWGVRVLADLVAHWDKRNVDAVRTRLHPDRFDLALAEKLFGRYGPRLISEGRIHEVADDLMSWSPAPADDDLDEFAASGIHEAVAIRPQYARFFFGCEADDATVACAFDRRLNPFGDALGAMFSSDIGHWDVTDMSCCLADAWDLVERELLDKAQFEEFVFTNAVRFYAGANPDFFDGTRIAREAAAALAACGQRA